MAIPEYHTLLAGGGFGLVLGILIGCAFGWLLHRLKAKGDQAIEEAERPPEHFNCRCVTVGANIPYRKNAEPELERGTKQDQPERPFLRGSVTEFCMTHDVRRGNPFYPFPSVNVRAAARSVRKFSEQIGRLSKSLRADLAAIDDPLCPDHIEVSDQAPEPDSEGVKTPPSDLLEALHYLRDTVEEPPEANCACHVNPPCPDCVNYAPLRDAIKEADEILKREGWA